VLPSIRANLTRLGGKKTTLTVTQLTRMQLARQLSADLDSTTRWSLSEEGLEAVRSTRALSTCVVAGCSGFTHRIDLGCGGPASETS